ncbi:MAG: gamma-glutamyl-gamma-aminobutyrate hydrolase family protein [Ignavibacteriae bacterium]|nr:gamma-glutamyl-gamma-aminobutyrate hydrolase family protein [Ignavibacteriota bacterium]
MKIAISRASGTAKYALYAHWLRLVEPSIEIIDLFVEPEQAEKNLMECSGLILTGGPDVNPEKYGKAERHDECFIDEDRDSLEFPIFEKARELKLPILGICRGAQLINVALWGTLFVDIHTDHPSDIHHQSNMQGDSSHKIDVVAGSLLKKITKTSEGEVNSAHHQAIEYLSEHLRTSAESPDGMIEAFEWNEPTGKPFLLGVQWHPERLEFDNVFSHRIAEHFIFEVESRSLLFRSL